MNCLYLLIFPILVPGLINLGARFMRRVHARSLSGELGLSLAMGMAILALFATFLGAVHHLSSILAWQILGALGIAGLVWVIQHGKSVLLAIGAFLKEETLFGRGAFFICLIVCAINLWFSLSPEIRHDPFDYHLNVANLDAVSGQIVEIPWHVFSYMPKYGEMLYSFVLLLGPDILGKLMHWTAGIAVLLLTYAIGQRIGGRGAGLISVFLTALIPLFSFLSTTCYVDLFVAMWALASIYCLILFSESDGARSPMLTGAFFLGMIMGTKYVAWGTIAPAILIAFVFLRLKRDGFVKAICFASVMLIIALLVCAPWLIYNFVWTGNPTYPLLAGIFGRHIPSCGTAEAFFRTHSPPEEALSITGIVPYLLMRLNRLLSEGILVFFTGFATAVFYIIRAKKIEYRFVGLIVFLSSFAFFIATNNHDGRFFFPTLALCAILTGLGITEIFSIVQEPQTKRTLTLGGIALAFGVMCFWVPQRINQVHVFEQQIIPHVSLEDREKVLLKRFPGFELVIWGNENLPSDALVLGLGYPLERRYISKNKHGYIPWLFDESDLSNPEYLANVLEKAGVTYIATPWPKLQEDVDFSILLPSYLTEVARSDERILYAFGPSKP